MLLSSRVVFLWLLRSYMLETSSLFSLRCFIFCESKHGPFAPTSYQTLTNTHPTGSEFDFSSLTQLFWYYKCLSIQCRKSICVLS